LIDRNIQLVSAFCFAYNKLLDRFDKEKEDGVTTGMFIEWQGDEYFIRMKNGNIQNIRKLWEIEE